MLAAWSENTYVQYQPHIQKWFDYSHKIRINSYQPNPSNIINFLQSLQDDYGTNYSSINTVRSALSLLIKFENLPIGQHPLVVECMKGLEHLCPPTPRYPYI